MAGPAAFHEQKGHLIEVGVLKGGALIPVDIGGRGFGSVIHHHYLKNQPFSRPFPLLALGATRLPWWREHAHLVAPGVGPGAAHHLLQYGVGRTRQPFHDIRGQERQPHHPAYLRYVHAFGLGDLGY